MFCEFYIPKKFCPSFVNEIPLFSTICPAICSRQVGMYDIYGYTFTQRPLPATKRPLAARPTLFNIHETFE